MKKKENVKEIMKKHDEKCRKKEISEIVKGFCLHTQNIRRFLGFAFVVVTCSTKSSTISMIFRNVFSLRKSTSNFGVSPSRGLQEQRDESNDGWPSGCLEDSSVECRFLQESDPRPRGLNPVQSDDARSTITFAGHPGSMERGVSAIDPKTF